jgi:long-subunit fatty acid transport protein
MNRNEFIGTVSAPLFPSFYAIYKKDKVAYSLGIVPVGGGGGAKFDNGIASFETNVAQIAGKLGARAYRYDTKFEGSSLNWGFQFNAAYAISDMFSLSVGARIVTAENGFSGILQNTEVELLVAPDTYVWTSPTPILAGLATQATGAATSIQPLIAGAGGLTLSQTVALGNPAFTAANATQLAGGLGSTDYTTFPLTLSQIQAAYSSMAAQLSFASAFTNPTNELKTTQKGVGITPILGLNVKVMDNLNVALKYEHLTNITVTNETESDVVGLYPDGAKTPNDMPGMFSFGVAYKPIAKLNVTAGYHLYLDKGANYGKKMGTPSAFVENDVVIDKNFWEAAFGVEYEVTDKILVSAGFLRTQTGVNADYQSDLSHSLSTNSIGLGGRYMVMENLGVNVGFMKTMYESYTKIFTGYEETYKRDAMVFAIGLDYNF